LNTAPKLNGVFRTNRKTVLIEAPKKKNPQGGGEKGRTTVKKQRQTRNPRAAGEKHLPISTKEISSQGRKSKTCIKDRIRGGERVF